MSHQVHVHGLTDQSVVVREERVSLDVVMDDGRRVQMIVSDDGRVSLRAWAAEAYLTENCEAASVTFQVPTAEEMILDGKQVSDLRLNTIAITASMLMSEHRPGSCWHMANDSTRGRAQALHTLMALRTPSA